MSVNGASLHSWSFDAMNVLTWAEEAGVSSAWLQFMALPGGHVFLGSLKTADTPEDAGPPLELASKQPLTGVPCTESADECQRTRPRPCEGL